MKDQWTDRLSEYLDGELSPAERTAIEGHLASCADCRATLDQLRRVVARAGALDDRPPETDLWPAVAARIGLAAAPQPARRRVAFTIPQLAAASIALCMLSGGSTWLLRKHEAGAGPLAGAARPTIPQLRPAANVGTDPRYAAAVADLERALAQNRSRLDTATVRVIEKNLAIIDRAIRDAQSALAADPGNSYLNLHLAQQQRRKLELLRQAASLAGTRS
jgi:putative zinc finger protein